MNDIFLKITALIVIVSLVAVMLRAYLPEYSFLIVLATVCSGVLFLMNSVFPQIENLYNLFEKSGNTNIYFKIALKTLGIAYITDFAENVCRDFGLSSLAQTVDFAGKVTIFVLSVPLITVIIQTVTKFIGL